MATNLNALAIRRVLGRGNWSTPVPFGPDGWCYDDLNGNASIIISCGDQLDGNEWVHASIARVDRMPSYDDLKLLHAAVFGDGWAYQVFAPPSDHVNIHSQALHLWGRLDGKPALPDFTYGTGSI
jgi:hypothetical protein